MSHVAIKYAYLSEIQKRAQENQVSCMFQNGFTSQQVQAIAELTSTQLLELAQRDDIDIKCNLSPDDIAEIANEIQASGSAKHALIKQIARKGM